MTAYPTPPQPKCSIIPPHILRALARSGVPELERRAEATLQRDTALRRERYTAEAAHPPASTAGPDPADWPRRRTKAQRAADPGPHRSIHDAERGTALPGALVRAEGADATGDLAADEAYDGLGATWELWHAAYGRDSLDGKGLPLVATVHYAKDYDNAFWDGDQMVFGDGDGIIFERFTKSVDVIGHELAHGVTQYTSGLVYRDQSGALNEHISDVFGVLVAQRLAGQRADEADWLVGADLLAPGVKGKALRSMAEPGTAYDDPRLGRDPQPAHMRDFVDTRSDNGGVHINSGIPNRAFYLVATALGGFAWERAGQIWVDTILGDISADCDFETFAALTEAAAAARFGPESSEVSAVREAWVTVGVVDRMPSEPVPAPTPEPVPAPTPGPQDGPTPGSPEVTVRRTGGFAGITRERSVSLAELPKRDAKAWGKLLQGRELRAAAARSDEVGHPDAFCYGVLCQEPAIDVSIAEPALKPATRDLLERTLEP